MRGFGLYEPTVVIIGDLGSCKISKGQDGIKRIVEFAKISFVSGNNSTGRCFLANKAIFQQK